MTIKQYFYYIAPDLDDQLTADTDVLGRDVRSLVAGGPLHLADVVVGPVVGSTHRTNYGLAALGADALRDAVLVYRALLPEATAQQVALV